MKKNKLIQTIIIAFSLTTLIACGAEDMNIAGQGFHEDNQLKNSAMNAAMGICEARYDACLEANPRGASKCDALYEACLSKTGFTGIENAGSSDEVMGSTSGEENEENEDHQENHEDVDEDHRD
jgi:hypothetical protein